MPDQNNPMDPSSTPAQVNPPSEPTQMPEPPTDIPSMDAPPFPPEPIEGAAPIDTTSGSAAPSFDIPPVVTPAEKPKRGGRKVIATILGLLVLVGGLGAGVILVRQQQDIRERAQSPTCYAECIAAGNTPSECRGLPACATSCVGLSISVCQNTAGCRWSNGVCVTTTVSQTPTPPPPPSTPRPTTSSCVGLSISACSARSDCYWSANNCLPRVASPSPSCNTGSCYNDCLCRGNTPSECSAGCPAASPTTPSCQTGQTLCTDANGNRACRDLRYDSRNCGACGRTCDTAAGQTCWQSSCVASTGGADGPCPAGYTSGGSNRDAAEEACEGRCGVRESPTANRICENGEFMRPGTGTIPNWCYRCVGTGGGTSAPAPTSPPPGTTPTAQCLDVKAYNTSWTQLTVAQLSQLRAGDRVRFTVAGTSVGGGSIDRARFRINGVTRPEVTQKKPGTEEYYDEYIIPSGTTTFSIHAQIHHTTLGWSE